jgi:hypothetical protein
MLIIIVNKGINRHERIIFILLTVNGLLHWILGKKIDVQIQVKFLNTSHLSKHEFIESHFILM